MRLLAWPNQFDDEGGWLPVEAKSLNVYASPNELRQLAKFLESAAIEMEAALHAGAECSRSIDFQDDALGAQPPCLAEIGVQIEVIADSDLKASDQG